MRAGEPVCGDWRGGHLTDDQTGEKIWLGLLGGGTAVLIWAGWIAATRWSMVERIDPLVLAICRNGLPALILLPVWWRRGIIPRDANIGAILMMTLGWGMPFTLTVGTGLSSVPASLFGPLVPGLAPLLVAGLGWALFRRVPGRGAALGLLLMAVALTCVLGQWVAAERWAEMGGAPFLLAASLGISIFTVMLPRSGLNPVEGTAYICLYSMPFLALAWVLNPGVFDGMSAGDIGFQALVQGVITGLFAVLAYGLAIRHLGPLRGSTANALVPVCAAITALVLLGESMTMLDWVAVACSSLGVAAVNGVFRRWIGE